ncbi:MAG: acyl-CoA dehydrogenase [bacterium]|nr:acyl-CoA dehydrogenase [bacterium]
MDLRYSEKDEEFRADLRTWLEREVPAHGAPPPVNDWPARRAYDTGWQRKLFDAGYAGISWPKEYGGRDGSPTEQLVYYEEIARVNAPYIGVNFVGMLHGGPTLIAEGTPEQKKCHVPQILTGEQVWCQGFSEPGAGSDLAALATRAEVDGDHYVVSGHKIWCSFAQAADYCELLVRTDPEAKSRGITWLIMDMNSPGIEIRPLRTLAGEGEFSEVFLDNVRIPVSNRVGKENDGWRVKEVTFRFERGAAFASDMIHLKQFVSELVDLTRRAPEGPQGWNDRALRRQLGHFSAELDALWAMVKLSVCESSKTGIPGVGASAVKLFYTDLYQRITEFGVRLLGRAALSRDDVAGLPSERILARSMQALSLTIAAGTSQIQRNIISERILGLPREPRPAPPPRPAVES